MRLTDLLDIRIVTLVSSDNPIHLIIYCNSVNIKFTLFYLSQEREVQNNRKCKFYRRSDHNQVKEWGFSHPHCKVVYIKNIEFLLFPFK